MTLFMLASVFVTPVTAYATPLTVQFVAADKLEGDLFGKWLLDELNVGQFFLFNFGAAFVDNQLSLVGKTFTSPNKFWQVKFTNILTFDLFQPVERFVGVTGTFQHITKADTQDTRDTGDPFEFVLIIGDGIVASNSQSRSGETEHPAIIPALPPLPSFPFPHMDFHEARLFADPASFSNYAFSVGASHPAQDILFSPDGGILIPEPITLSLISLGLVGIGFARWRRTPVPSYCINRHFRELHQPCSPQL